MNKGKLSIYGGLLLFLAAVAVPSLLLMRDNNHSSAPKIELPGQEKECVEPAEYMRKNHKLLLSRWRDSAVRKGAREYAGKNRKKFSVSLSGTCVTCHEKEKFCDRCHLKVGVAPDCWKCHIVPEAGHGVK